MKERSRFPELGCLVLVILGIGVVVWFLSNAVPHMRYNRRAERINEKIHSLLPRRPADVSERLAETGPHGRRYMTMWREHWESILKAPGQEGQP